MFQWIPKISILLLLVILHCLSTDAFTFSSQKRVSHRVQQHLLESVIDRDMFEEEEEEEAAIVNKDPMEYQFQVSQIEDAEEEGRDTSGLDGDENEGGEDIGEQVFDDVGEEQEEGGILSLSAILEEVDTQKELQQQYLESTMNDVRVASKADNEDKEDDEDYLFVSKRAIKSHCYLLLRNVAQAIHRRDRSSPRKAQKVVAQIEDELQGKPIRDMQPLVQAYNLWIHALAKTANDPGPEAERLLKQMMLDPRIEPDVFTYTNVIDAYARSKSPKDAERILFQLLEQQLYNPKLKVTAVPCDTVLNAWAQTGTLKAAQRAHSIVQRLMHMPTIQPTEYSYTIVMNAFAKCRAPEQAERILTDLLESNGQDVKVETFMFNVALKAWANSGDARAGSQAQRLLAKMQHLHETRKLETQPDTVSYNTVISAWAHSGHINAAIEAEKVLQGMHIQAKASVDAPRPNTISYNSVLHAYAYAPTTLNLSPSPARRASKLLDYMIRSNNPDISPDVISFSSALNAWARSKEHDKAIQAQRILSLLLEMSSRPRSKLLVKNAIPFHAVLNACAFSATDKDNNLMPLDSRKEALQIAVSTFSKLKQQPRVRPDTISYGNLMKCCANLMPPGRPRTELAKVVFRQCCQDGMVGELVWDEARRAIPPRLLMREVIPRKYHMKGGVKSMGLRHLPPHWCENVPEKNRRRLKPKKPVDTKNKQQRETTLPTHGPRGISESLWSGKQL